MVASYRRKFVQHRARTIARTETRRAMSVGADLMWQQQIAAGNVDARQMVKEWVYTQDGRTRHAHRSIPDKNPDGVAMDRPFVSDLGPIRYPGDPAASVANTANCRCTVFYRVLSAELAFSSSRLAAA